MSRLANKAMKLTPLTRRHLAKTLKSITLVGPIYRVVDVALATRQKNPRTRRGEFMA